MKQDKQSSFVVVIKDTQYDTWQGSIEWIEGKKRENFRSVLEMIKLMDSTIENEKKDAK